MKASTWDSDPQGQKSLDGSFSLRMEEMKQIRFCGNSITCTKSKGLNLCKLKNDNEEFLNDSILTQILNPFKFNSVVLIICFVDSVKNIC